MTDEEAIALATLTGMRAVILKDKTPRDCNSPVYSSQTIYVRSLDIIYALEWHCYRVAPSELRGSFASLGELAQEWCRYKGLS